MPGLYGLGANVTVNSSNTTGLYAVANTGNVYSGNISSSNTTGLYIGAGTPTFLNNAELLLLLLDNNGNVNFALDPTTNNSTVYSYFVGSIPEVYGNGNVAAFLPTYTGTLDNSSTIINLLANAAAQSVSINVINANLGAFETYANATFATGSTYSNANVAAYLPINSANVAAAYFIGDGSLLTNLPGGVGSYGNANVAAYLPTYTGTLALSSTIIDLYANAAAQAIDIGTLFTNQTTLQNELVAVNANVVAANLNIATLDANLGAFEAYANATFTVSSYGNANVAAYLPVYNGVIGATQIQDNDGTALNLASNNYVQMQYDPTATYDEGDIKNGNWAYVGAGGFFFQSNATGVIKGVNINDDANVFTEGSFITTNGVFWANGDPYSSGGSDYGNANVAAYLPTYTGTLALSSTIIDLYANAASQAIDIGTLFTNQTTLQNEITAANLNIDAVNANLGSYQSWANLEITSTNANVAAANLVISDLSANLGAFEIYANIHFGDSNYGNANVAEFLPTYGGNVALEYITNGSANWHFESSGMLTTAGSMTMPPGAYIIAPNEVSTGLLVASTAVKTDTYQFANGAPVSFYSDAAVAAYLPTYGGNIALSYITAGANANWFFENNGRLTSNYAGGGLYLGSFATVYSEGGTVDVRGGGFGGGYVYAGVVAADRFNYANSQSILDDIHAVNVVVSTDLVMPSGDNAARPAFASNGSIRFNTESSTPEYYDSALAAWLPMGSSTYGNANVAAYLPTYTGDIGSSSSPAGTAWFQNLNSILGLTILGPSVQFGDGLTPTPVTAYGNITAATSYYFIGDGSQLTNLPVQTGTYGNANVAAYLPTYTGSLENSSSIISLRDNLATLDANVGAFETYANATFGPSSAGFYSNANVAAYLPVYGGNILATVIEPLQPYIRSIGSNNNTSVTYVNGGGDVRINANSSSSGGGIQIVAGNTAVKDSGTWFAEASKFTFQSHNGVNNGNDPSDYMKITVPAAVYGQFQETSTEFGANTFSVYDGNVYIGPSDNPVAGSGILRVQNRILVNNGGVSLIGDTIATVGVINSGGNVTAPYFIGDGSQLTNVPTSYGNTQVAQYLPVYTGNIGNVSQTTGRRYIYSGNIDVSAVATNGIVNIKAGSTPNTSDGYLNLNANFVGIGSVADGATVEVYSPTSITQNNAGTGNVLSITGNLKVAAGAFGGGNVAATYFIGDGSKLTGITTSYGNTQVAAYLPTYTGDIAANITDGVQPYIYDIGSILNATSIRGAGVSILGTGSNITLNTGNSSAYVNNIIGKFRSTTNVEVVTGAYFIGDGSKLTGISSSSYGNVEVAAYLPTYTGTLAQSSTIVDLYSNAATQATAINSINANLGTLYLGNISTQANLGAFQTYANATFGGGSYGNTQVAEYLPSYTGSLAYTSQTANVNYNSQYISNAILSTTQEKTANLGVIQGTVTIDANIGPIQTAVVTANITINTTNLTNMGVGESVTLVLTQNTNANLRILTSNLKYAGASKTLSTANAAIDTISITYDGTNYLAALVKGYA